MAWRGRAQHDGANRVSAYHTEPSTARYAVTLASMAMHLMSHRGVLWHSNEHTLLERHSNALGDSSQKSCKYHTP
eukprot:9490970-Pyramimonas_sp.AAC.1